MHFPVLTCKGVECNAKDLQATKADFVVVTATAPATQSITFDPILSQNKSVALRRVYYESSTKVILVFTEAFWASNDGDRKGGSVTSDLRGQTIYYPPTKYSNTGMKYSF